MNKTIFTVLCLCMLSSCSFPQHEVNAKFGKQHFVSAVAFIELHKTRNGAYPDALSDLQYLGDWDLIWLNAVRYEKSENGYNLYIENGWIGEPELAFPEAFRIGLGIKQTNVLWSNESHSQDELKKEIRL